MMNLSEILERMKNVKLSLKLSTGKNIMLDLSDWRVTADATEETTKKMSTLILQEWKTKNDHRKLEEKEYKEAFEQLVEHFANIAKAKKSDESKKGKKKEPKVFDH